MAVGLTITVGSWLVSAEEAYRHYPKALLHWHLRSDNPHVVLRAWDEFDRREAGGHLTPADHAALDRVAWANLTTTPADRPKVRDLLERSLDRLYPAGSRVDHLPPHGEAVLDALIRMHLTLPVGHRHADWPMDAFVSRTLKSVGVLGWMPRHSALSEDRFERLMRALTYRPAGERVTLQLLDEMSLWDSAYRAWAWESEAGIASKYEPQPFPRSKDEAQVIARWLLTIDPDNYWRGNDASYLLRQLDEDGWLTPDQSAALNQRTVDTAD